MTCSLKSLVLAKAILELLKFPGIKLNDFAALDTEHMIMMLMAECALINSSMLRLFHPLDESAFTHQGQRPVNGSTRRLHTGALYLQIKVFGVKMASQRECFLQDGRTLFCASPSPLFEELFEDFPFHKIEIESQ